MVALNLIQQACWICSEEIRPMQGNTYTAFVIPISTFSLKCSKTLAKSHFNKSQGTVEGLEQDDKTFDLKKSSFYYELGIIMKRSHFSRPLRNPICIFIFFIYFFIYVSEETRSYTELPKLSISAVEVKIF